MEYSSIDVYGVERLEDVLHILSGEEASDLLVKNRPQMASGPEGLEKDSSVMDFAEIIGQEAAKRGLEIAAGGGHNAILIGSPGS